MGINFVAKYATPDPPPTGEDRPAVVLFIVEDKPLGDDGSVMTEEMKESLKHG